MAFAIRASRCGGRGENAALRPESPDQLEMSNTLQLSCDKPELSGGSNTSVFQSFAVHSSDSTVTERFEETRTFLTPCLIWNLELITATRLAPFGG
jgi:hypothetical protein